MEKRPLIFFSTLIVCTLILSGIIIYQLWSVPLSPSLPESACNVLKESPQGSINIVFFSDKQTAQKYTDALLASSPFAGNADAFNTYYIQNYTPHCELYQGIAIMCYSKELLKAAAACPSDYVVVLDGSQTPSIRSSTYLNVLSLNVAQSTPVFLHEFAHAFANLADEYVPATLPITSKNCVRTCTDFDSMNQGCFQGCADTNHIRSIDRGLMRTLSSNEYGDYNEHLLYDRIEKSLSPPVASTGNAIAPITNPSDCASEQYYLIEAYYNITTNKTKILDRTLETGCAGGNGYGEGSYTIFDSVQNQKIQKTFNPLYVFTDAPNGLELEGGPLIADTPFSIRVPASVSSLSLEVTINNNSIQVPLEDIGGRPCTL